MARVLGEQPPGALGPRVDLLRALANEADVFASLLPRLGWKLADLLAEEWRASGHAARASQVVGFTGRLSFLRVYSRFTDAATRLGCAALQAAQLAAFPTAARLPAGASAEQAAALLDALAPALASPPPCRDGRRKQTDLAHVPLTGGTADKLRPATLR
jgi:hypothetical protein